MQRELETTEELLQQKETSARAIERLEFKIHHLALSKN